MGRSPPGRAPVTLAQIEADLTTLLEAAVSAALKAHRGVYAVALHGIYRERERVLSLPTLAVGTDDHPDEGTFWSRRWSPADWTNQELVLPAARARALEQALTVLAKRHWDRTEAAYFRALVRIAKRLTRLLPKGAVAYVHDEEGGAELAGRSLTKAQRERFFATELARARELARVKAEPAPTRADFLVTRFGIFEGVSHETAEKELVALGAAAIPALLRVLPGPHGDTAARVLGRIGDARPEILDALRSRGTELWFAKALGMLGHPASLHGYLAPLLAISETERPLDYRPLESFLDAHPEERKCAAADLAPGRSYCHIRAADVPEAVRGLASKYAVVRWHAASVLGRRRLKSKLIEPALTAAQMDRNEDVRRLASQSLAARAG